LTKNFCGRRRKHDTRKKREPKRRLPTEGGKSRPPPQWGGLLENQSKWGEKREEKKQEPTFKSERGEEVGMTGEEGEGEDNLPTRCRKGKRLQEKKIRTKHTSRRQ